MNPPVNDPDGQLNALIEENERLKAQIEKQIRIGVETEKAHKRELEWNRQLQAGAVRLLSEAAQRELERIVDLGVDSPAAHEAAGRAAGISHSLRVVAEVLDIDVAGLLPNELMETVK